MEVFAYCFMPSHVHLIFRSSSEDPSGLIRDFKGYTARKPTRKQKRMVVMDDGTSRQKEK